MLEGKNVNLKPAEQEDVSLLSQWLRNPSYMGEYEDVKDISEAGLLQRILNPNIKFFIIVKNKDAKIGHIDTWPVGKAREIGFALLPEERRKGYMTEAIRLMIGYLFETTEIIRIQARANTSNTASKKALTKNGFIREGTMRKSGYMRKAYYDEDMYSILREEWKEPKILTSA